MPEFIKMYRKQIYLKTGDDEPISSQALLSDKKDLLCIFNQLIPIYLLLNRRLTINLPQSFLM